MERITPEHIDKLFAFTRKHLVEYHDVQLELVDHLANNQKRDVGIFFHSKGLFVVAVILFTVPYLYL